MASRNMINLATFNIYWYPSSNFAKNQRSEDDQGRVGRVLANLGAHAVVFQEILDLRRLEALLAGMGGHDYRLRKKPGGEWLSSGKATSTASQKIVCAYDAAVLDLIAGAALVNPEPYPGYAGRRNPYALHIRERSTGWEFTLVGLHLKSNDPRFVVPNPKDPEGRDLRERETTFLAAWLSGDVGLKPGHFQSPPTGDVVVMGDFNSVTSLPALSSLHQGTLADWDWPEPTIVNSLEPNVPVTDPLEQWSTHLDKVVIDHALVSPGMKTRVAAASIYALDLDPALDEQPGIAGPWLRRETDYWIGGQLVENLFRISDHRPLRVTVRST